MGLSIGELRGRQRQWRPALKKVAGKRTKAATATAAAGHNATWRNAHLYACVREGGQVFAHEQEINTFYKSRQLEEAHLWLFKHKDARATRNEITPLYEAVWAIGPTDRRRWVLAQKCHLAFVYGRAKRTRTDAMWSVLEDGTPYWVDRFAYRKVKQKSAKRRYENKLLK